MTNKKKSIVIEDAEFGVDSRYKSNKERESDASALMEARLRRMKNLSKDQIIRAKLVQLKLKSMLENATMRECVNAGMREWKKG